MENREIMVADTKTNRRYKFTTSATTLAELKNDMTAQGIDYSGLSFTEGVSNTQLLDDNSVLPANVPYKGRVTNNLVILLTNTTKNIASGVLGTRAEAYAAIRKLDLQDKVKAEFDRNFTQVPTKDLWNIIAITKKASKPAEDGDSLDDMTDDILARHGFNADEREDAPSESEREDERQAALADAAVNAIGALAEHFYNEGAINYDDDYDTICNVIRTALE